MKMKTDNEKKRVLVYRNEGQVNGARHLTEQLLGDVQKVYTEAAKIDLNLPDAPDLWPVILNPENYFREHLKAKTGEQSINGVKLNIDAMIDIMEKPDIRDFISACENLRNLQARRGANFRLFKLEKGKVTINESALQEHAEALSIYAESDAEKKLFEKIKGVADAINDLSDHLSGIGAGTAGLHNLKYFVRDEMKNHKWKVIIDFGKYQELARLLKV